MKFLQLAALAATIVLALNPSAARACACGCGVFDVGGDTMIAGDAAHEVFVEYDYLDQTTNWNGAKQAPAANNTDKEIKSNFLVVGGQVMINQDWSLMGELPVTNRAFRTTDPGMATTFNDTSLGDIRLMAVYTGLSKDMSTGLIAGVRLPTGDFRAAGFDRDVEIGSGSTDLLLGAYHSGAVGKSETWTYLVQAFADVPLAGQDGYVPGDEVDASAAITYGGWSSKDGKLKLEPLLQLIGSLRAPDHGPAADPDNTGYQRLLISPGVQLVAGNWKLYGDVEFPVAQYVKGNQLIAPEQFKLVLSRSF
ncbi:MAG TPA: hypothetical protein VII42_10790 [Caulobacteraceae bacterium]|jgi:hypothetical protein